MVNYTVLGWDSLSHHRRNLSIGPVSYLIGGFRCDAFVEQKKTNFGPQKGVLKFMLEINVMILTNYLHMKTSWKIYMKSNI